MVLRCAPEAQRSASSIVPPIWLLAAAAQGVLALFVAEVPSEAIGGVLICVSTIACAALAWRVTEMPALLSGDDITVEQIVDARLRQRRAAVILYFAFVQTFVFLTQIGARHQSVTLNDVTTASTVLLFAYTVWFMYTFLRRVDLAPASA
jgi:hypothetical protein